MSVFITFHSIKGPTIRVFACFPRFAPFGFRVSFVSFLLQDERSRNGSFHVRLQKLRRWMEREAALRWSRSFGSFHLRSPKKARPSGFRLRFLRRDPILLLHDHAFFGCFSGNSIQLPSPSTPFSLRFWCVNAVYVLFRSDNSYRRS